MAFATIDMTKGITGTIPVANGGTGLASGTTGQFLKFTGTTTVASAAVDPGITMADNWRITSGATGVNTPLTSNWERVDTSGQGTIGSAMTQSSGVFSFGNTGIYQITFMAYLEGNDESRYNTINIMGTINNSSYVNLTESSQFHQSTQSNTAYACVMCSTYFDVTDTSNCKVRFHYAPATTNITLIGASSYNATNVMFIRLGDT